MATPSAPPIHPAAAPQRLRQRLGGGGPRRKAAAATLPQKAQSNPVQPASPARHSPGRTPVSANRSVSSPQLQQQTPSITACSSCNRCTSSLASTEAAACSRSCNRQRGGTGGGRPDSTVRVQVGVTGRPARTGVWGGGCRKGLPPSMRRQRRHHGRAVPVAGSLPPPLASRQAVRYRPGQASGS